MGRLQVAEFGFITSRSFLKSPSKTITVPGRFYKKIKNTMEIETKTASAEVDCGNNVRTRGSIYWGLRAGGPYYQVRVHSRGIKDYFEKLRVGTTLKISIAKSNGLWEITLAEG